MLSFEAVVDKFNSLPKPIQQVSIGTTTGWLSGYAFSKFGRLASASVGATILLVQMGQHYGYINIDWRRVNRDLKRAQTEVKKHADAHAPEIASQVQNCIKNNVALVSSFAGGFLLGVASA